MAIWRQNKLWRSLKIPNRRSITIFGIKRKAKWPSLFLNVYCLMFYRKKSPDSLNWPQLSPWQVVFPESATSHATFGFILGGISWSRGCGFESHRWLVSLFLVRFLSISLSLISPWPGSSKSCNSAYENFWMVAPGWAAWSKTGSISTW